MQKDNKLFWKIENERFRWRAKESDEIMNEGIRLKTYPINLTFNNDQTILIHAIHLFLYIC